VSRQTELARFEVQETSSVANEQEMGLLEWTAEQNVGDDAFAKAAYERRIERQLSCHVYNGVHADHGSTLVVGGFQVRDIGLIRPSSKGKSYKNINVTGSKAALGTQFGDKGIFD